MFKGNLIKYVRLLDTPFLVGEEENGRNSSLEEKLEEEHNVFNEDKDRVEEELLAKREELKEEIKELEKRIRELSSQAEDIIKRAHKEAEEIKRKADEEAKRASEKIIREAKGEADSIREKAFNDGFKKGYDEGYREGIKEGRKEYDDLIALLRSVIEGIKSSKDKLLEEIEPEVIEIIKIVLRKLLLKEVEVDRDLVIRVIKAAVKKLEERAKIVVRVNPDDLPKVVERREELFSSIEGLKELDIIEDSRVERGGCVVEGGLGVVDARIERQIEEIERFIDRLLKEGRGESLA